MQAGTNQGRQNQNLSSILTAWEECTLAKHYPGVRKAPFVAGMNQVSLNTGTLRGQTSWTQLANFQSSSESYTDIGSKRYTVIAFCPALTALYSSQMSARSSGIVAGITDITTEENFVRIQDFGQVSQGFSMIDIWKSDGSTIFQNSMVWAHEVKVVMNGPLANASGVAYMGYFPFGALLGTDNSTETNFTLG